VFVKLVLYGFMESVTEILVVLPIQHGMVKAASVIRALLCSKENASQFKYPNLYVLPIVISMEFFALATADLTKFLWECVENVLKEHFGTEICVKTQQYVNLGISTTKDKNAVFLKE